MTVKVPDRARCVAELDRLLGECEAIRAGILALRDGRPFAHSARVGIDAGKLAAMASSLSALGTSVLRELAAGNLDHVLIEGAEGKLVVAAVPGYGGVLILAVLAEPSALLGLVLGRGKACAQALGAACASDA